MPRLVVHDRVTRAHDAPGGGITAILLAGILLVAAVPRVIGLDWDEGRYLHPDERFLAQVESAVALPSSLREYLDTANSPLNPNNRNFGFFVYGTMPVAAVRLIATWLALPGNDLDRAAFGTDLSPEYGSVYLVGRAVSVLCDLLTTLLTFAVGAALYGRPAGLLAAVLYATAVLPIQQAHFFTVDAIATLFTAAALWLAARAATRARWSDDVLFGITLGAALACKISIFPAVALLGISIVLRFSAHRNAVRGAASLAEHERLRRSIALAVRAALTANIVVLAAAFAFRVLQPYAFVPPYAGPPPAVASVRAAQMLFNLAAPRWNPSWLEQMERARAQQTGADDSPPNHQWATRPPLLFAWLNMVRFGMGWPLGLVAWTGWAWALAEGLRGRRESWRHVLPVSWIGLYFAWTAAAWVASMRYFLPIYPALAITAAWALVRLAAPDLDASNPTGHGGARRRRVLGCAAIAAVVIATAAWAWAFTRIYAQPHTRIAASRWIYRTVPSAVTLVVDGESGRFEQALNVNTGQSRTEAGVPQPGVITVGPELTAAARFRLDQSARAIEVRFHRIQLRDLPPAPGARVVTATISSDHGQALASCVVPSFAAGESTVHDASCRLEPVPFDPTREYMLRIDAHPAVEVAGATLANEGSWDDALPVPLPGINPEGRYAEYALEMVWEDDERKRARLQLILDQSEYITISSNRFYDSLSRNPRRWPMTLEYYRALFTGELGFALAADFTASPRLGPWRIDDQSAEEAFTVYDHPRVLIFSKTSAYDPARTAAILAQADLHQVERKTAAHVTEEPVELPLPSVSGLPGGL